MSVHLCRHCKNYMDGKCFSEKRRAMFRHDGSVGFRHPADMGPNDGCDNGFQDGKED